MKKYFLMLVLAPLLLGCSVEPVPIDFSKDACDFCKMIIMDPKFGSEIVTSKGKVFKFDDINCMVQFAGEKELNTENVAHWLVIDYANPQQLIDAKSAHYLQSATIKSPMASKAAAFETESSRTEVSAQLENPNNLDWTGIQEVLK